MGHQCYFTHEERSAREQARRERETIARNRAEELRREEAQRKYLEERRIVENYLRQAEERDRIKQRDEQREADRVSRLSASARADYNKNRR